MIGWPGEASHSHHHLSVVNQKEALTELASVVRPGGHVATLMGAADVELLASRQVVATNVMAAPTAEKLSLLAELAESGALRVRIVTAPTPSTAPTRCSRRSSAAPAARSF